MLYITVLAFVVGYTTAAPAPGFTWRSCSDDPANTALTVESLSVSPTPVTLPGEMRVSLNATVNRRIDSLFLDVQLNRSEATGDINIPCIPGTDLGSCKNIDACQILTNILNGTSAVSVDLGQQLDAILLSALGHNAQCPVNPEHVQINDEVIQLKPLPTLLSAFLSDATYNMRFTIKDSIAATTNIGCLEVSIGLVAKSTGFLFGGTGSGTA